MATVRIRTVEDGGEQDFAKRLSFGESICVCVLGNDRHALNF